MLHFCTLLYSWQFMHPARTRKFRLILGAILLAPYAFFFTPYAMILVDQDISPRLVDYAVLIMMLAYPIVLLISVVISVLDYRKGGGRIILASTPLLYTAFVLTIWIVSVLSFGA
jgi:hypothetical protein